MPMTAENNKTVYRARAIYMPAERSRMLNKYVKLIALMLLSLFFFLINANGQQFQAKLSGTSERSNGGYEPGSIIVKLKKGIVPAEQKTGSAATGIAALDRLNAQYNCTSAVRLNTGIQDRQTNFTFKLNFAATADVQALIKAYTATGVLEYAEPDYIAGINTVTPNDPYFQYSWGLNNNGTFAYSSYTPVAGADMDMKKAWDITQGSSAITVAVIDAGAKLDHPEFSGRIWQNTDEVAGNGIDDDGNGYIDDYRGWNFVSGNNNPTDDNGHGTNVMGIIGANGNNSIGYAGVDWNCKLMVLKTQNSSGSGSYSAMASAIYYAADNGAKVINMSLGGSASATALQDAINYAYAHNVTVVAAMGNNNSSVPSYPGSCTHVIAVGATTCADTRASFSNYGSHISVVAPGDVIFGLSYLSNTDYTTGMSGTSQATPAVAGVLALLLAQNPARTPDQLRTIIESTAEDQVGSASEDVPGFDIYYGHGRVNAFAALSGCAAPVVGAISGAASLCAGASITLSDTTLAGIWSSGSTGIVTVSASGIVTGIAAGTANISYIKTNSCGTTVVTKAVTVNAVPTAITGTASLCPGAASTLASTPSGGTWSSGATGIVSIGSSTGIATAVSSGTAVLTYNRTGCTTTKIVTVNTALSAISGTGTLCQGSATTLADAATGGAWTSGNTSVATVGAATGVVSGIAAGTAVITYAVGSCSATRIITVNALPLAITGSSALCIGATGAMSDGVAGGTWSSSNTSVATISGGGIVSGLSAGTSGISYTLPSGCYTTKTVTISGSTSAITGNQSLCIGTTSTLLNATAGGTWASSSPAVATVGLSTGIVSGVAAGTATITYTVGSGCSATAIITVVSAPAAITGSLFTCSGATTTLANAMPGGTWSSGNPTIATVNAAGTVTGITTGMANITYTAGGAGCRAVALVTVSNTIAAITGAAPVCAGLTIALANPVPGGTWSSRNTAIATVNASGIVTGVSSGVVAISYILPGGCYRTTNVPVKALPAAISGNTGLCVGATSVVTDGTGVSWTSSNPSVATIGATSGLITGIAPGTATITFLATTGCTATKVATVDAAPSVPAISGPSSVSAGSTITLANAVPGGTWTSNSIARATVDASGTVTGISAPAATISYTVTNGACKVSVTKLITIAAHKGEPGVASATGAVELRMFPNPTSGSFNLETPVAGTLIIYTLDGREIQHSNVAEGSNALSLPGGLTAGIYLCKFIGGDDTIITTRLMYQP